MVVQFYYVYLRTVLRHVKIVRVVHRLLGSERRQEPAGIDIEHEASHRCRIDREWIRSIDQIQSLASVSDAVNLRADRRMAVLLEKRAVASEEARYSAVLPIGDVNIVQLARERQSVRDEERVRRWHLRENGL